MHAKGVLAFIVTLHCHPLYCFIVFDHGVTLQRYCYTLARSLRTEGAQAGDIERNRIGSGVTGANPGDGGWGGNMCFATGHWKEHGEEACPRGPKKDI
ncbi:hypothetical protein AC579_7540 [Pseudocercospora musae]|uniref:Secreted protein n=1 Tax=Pseudocercospora musae TaxID=113226 RepID=A0A139IHQ9_9PEZI|nr:hypothetical protein AC579_7540 [Pseudocercospora musae]